MNIPSARTTAQFLSKDSRSPRRRHPREHAGQQHLIDELTGLLARGPFVEHVRDTLPEVECRDGRLAVVTIGIDRLAALHDSIGHVHGDRILAAMAQRIEALVDSAVIARTGIDEFAILLDDVHDEADVIALCDRLLDSIAMPISFFAAELMLTASAGVAFGAEADEDPQRIVENASAARHNAGAAGGACARVFDESIRTEAWERIVLESELRRALQRGELSVHYQPVVDLRDGSTGALEALVRWQHPVRGWISPADFIPLAEETGLVAQIGLFVLGEVTRQMAAWTQSGSELANVRVSLNASSRELCDGRLVGSIESAIARHGIRPDRLCIEITESALMTDWRVALGAAEKIRALGLHLALDDFGTGYSSLLQLKRLPFDAVKIDRSFVAGLGSDPRSMAMVDAVCALARNLGLQVIPEGVETRQQMEWLRAHGCKAAQGFLWSPALPASQLEVWVRRGQRRMA